MGISIALTFSGLTGTSSTHLTIETHWYSVSWWQHEAGSFVVFSTLSSFSILIAWRLSHVDAMAR